MSFADPNYVLNRTYLAIVNSARVLSHLTIRLRHEPSSIGRIIRSSKGHDLLDLRKSDRAQIHDQEKVKSSTFHRNLYFNNKSFNITIKTEP